MSYLGAYLGQSGGTIVIYVTAPPPTLPDAVVSPFEPTAPEYVDHVASAIDRLCQVFREKREA